MPRHRLFFLAIGLAVLLGALPARALYSNLPPGSNFNLANWKITLPVDSNGTNIGNAIEKTAAELVAGYTNAVYFYTAPDGAMVFWCPISGATTSGSTYPRSELRELLNPANDNINWNSAVGIHTLDGVCKVTQVPSTGKVIIGQIHGFSGNAYPMIKMQFESSSIRCLCKSDPAGDGTDDIILTFPNPGVNKLISYRIQTFGTNLNVTVNNTTLVGNISLWGGAICYFKAGNYCQDNVGTNGEGSSVSFYSLNVNHVTNSSPAPVIGTQPLTQTVPLGSNVTLNVIATGTNILSYQWRTNFANRLGWTNSTLLLTNFQASNQMVFDVVITNTSGAVTSAVARLYLDAPLRLTNFSYLNASNRTVTVFGKAGNFFTLQASSNLINWDGVVTNRPASGIQTFTDRDRKSTRLNSSHSS